MDTSLFVFFTINGKNIGKSWPNWNEYPEGWRLIGSGCTRPTCSDGHYPIYRYHSEDQYGGSCLNRHEMKEKLYKYYNKLIKKDYIIDYVIADSYNEIDNYIIN